jgi:hypothetical protein
MKGLEYLVGYLEECWQEYLVGYLEECLVVY